MPQVLRVIAKLVLNNFLLIFHRFGVDGLLLDEARAFPRHVTDCGQ